MNDKVLADAKKLARETGRTLTAVMEGAPRVAIAGRRQRRKFVPANLTTFKGNGLQPGVDLDNSAALLDLMEGREGY